MTISAPATSEAAATVVPAAPAEAVIDLSAIRANTAALRRAADGAALLAVVKADGYGHGAAPVARAALAGGADMIGVATLAEAVALREAGITAPLAAWLWPPSAPVGAAIAAGIQIGVSSVAQLRAVTAAAGAAGDRFALPADIVGTGRVPIHLKVDTGLSRNGATLTDLPSLLAAARAAEEAGAVCVVGIMSHLACADDPADPTTAAQTAVFVEAVSAAQAAGLRPRWRHLANTAGTLAHPDTRFDLVRCGIGLYGLPSVATDLPLTPAMTLRARVALTKQVPAGTGVGYGLAYRTAADTTLALIPIGYGDGLPRIASNIGQVWIAGRRYRIAGRVAMDQVVVDCGTHPVAVDDEVIIFGPGGNDEPTATEWADWCQTIDYEIVTRIGARVPRRHTG